MPTNVSNSKGYTLSPNLTEIRVSFKLANHAEELIAFRMLEMVAP